MAGNYLTIGARFNPLSYQEIIAPLQQQTEEQNLLEEQYGQLGQAAGVFDGTIDSNNSPKAAARLKDYTDQLQKVSQELGSKGLTPQSRNALSKMKAGYTTTIAPIEQAQKRQAQLLDEERTMRRTNPMLYSNLTSKTTSIDYLIDNPNVVPEYENAALLMDQVANAVAAKAGDTREDTGWKSTLNGQQWERKIKMGLKPEDIQAVMRGEGPKELQDIVNNVLSSSKASKWENYQQIAPQLYQQVATGLKAGLAPDRIEREKNLGFETTGQKLENQLRNMQIQEEKIKLDALRHPTQPERDLTWEQMGAEADTSKNQVVKQLNKDMEVINKLVSIPLSEANKVLTTKAKLTRYNPLIAASQKKIDDIKNFYKVNNIKTYKPQDLAKIKSLETYMDSVRKAAKEHKGPIDRYGTLGPDKWVETSTSPSEERKIFDKYAKKYNTNKLSEIKARIEGEIGMSTSRLRESGIKSGDNTVLNNFIKDQVFLNEKNTGKDFITDEKRHSLSDKEKQTVFNESGRLTYNAEKGQLGMLNTSGTKVKYLLNKGTLSNVAINVYGPDGAIINDQITKGDTSRIPNAEEYLNYIDEVYKLYPTSTYVNRLLDHFYNVMEKYGNTFNQNKPKTNAKR